MFLPAVRGPPADGPRFARVNVNRHNNIDGAFADNTFEAKAKFGEEGDTFGIKVNEKLCVTHGKGFTKEKNKMKNKNFHSAGERITSKINSVKF